RLPRSMDMAGQCRLRDNSTTPNTRDEVVLADDPVTVPHEINQQIEDLRLDLDQIGAASELAPVDVKAMFPKAKFHDRSPPTRPSGPFSPPASRPCAIRRNRWIRTTRGFSARPAMHQERPSNGRCLRKDPHRPTSGLRRAPLRRVRFSPLRA